jgi:hypothetical protein
MSQAAAVLDSDLSFRELAHLFSARLEFTSDSPSDAIVPPEDRDGVFIGSGHGTVTGDQGEVWNGCSLQTPLHINIRTSSQVCITS